MICDCPPSLLDILDALFEPGQAPDPHPTPGSPRIVTAHCCAAVWGAVQSIAADGTEAESAKVKYWGPYYREWQQARIGPEGDIFEWKCLAAVARMAVDRAVGEGNITLFAGRRAWQHWLLEHPNPDPTPAVDIITLFQRARERKDRSPAAQAFLQEEIRALEQDVARDQAEQQRQADVRRYVQALSSCGDWCEAPVPENVHK